MSEVIATVTTPDPLAAVMSMVVPMGNGTEALAGIVIVWALDEVWKISLPASDARRV